MEGVSFISFFSRFSLFKTLAAIRFLLIWNVSLRTIWNIWNKFRKRHMSLLERSDDNDAQYPGWYGDDIRPGAWSGLITWPMTDPETERPRGRHGVTDVGTRNVDPQLSYHNFPLVNIPWVTPTPSFFHRPDAFFCRQTKSVEALKGNLGHPGVISGNVNRLNCSRK